MVKKLSVFVLVAAVLLVAAACGQSTEGKVVRYDPPAGYEITATGAGEDYESAEYVVYDASGEISKCIGVVVQRVEADITKALKSKKVANVEDALGVDFAENLSVTFTKIGIGEGIRIEETDDAGNLVDVTYYLSMGDWAVLVASADSTPRIDEVNEDIQALVKTMRLEDFVFTN